MAVDHAPLAGGWTLAYLQVQGMPLTAFKEGIMTPYLRLLEQYQNDCDFLVKEGFELMQAVSIVYLTYREMGITL
jgi:maleate cis-trans isomerase